MPGNLALGERVIGGIRFTGAHEALDAGSVYICHQLDRHFRGARLKSRLAIYGHDHVPRIYGNYLGLGFLRDPVPGVPEASRGGCFVVDVDGLCLDVRFISLGGMKASPCRIHKDQAPSSCRLTMGIGVPCAQTTPNTDSGFPAFPPILRADCRPTPGPGPCP